MDTEPKDQRVPVMFSASEVRAVDAWRRLHDGIPSRSEAIRRLVQTGLAEDSASAADAPSPTQLRPLLVEYWKASVAADPDLDLDGETPEAEADIGLRALGEAIQRWAYTHGLESDRDGSAAAIFRAIGALLPVPTSEEVVRLRDEEATARRKAQAEARRSRKPQT